MKVTESWEQYRKNKSALTPKQERAVKAIYYLAIYDGMQIVLQLVDKHISKKKKEAIAPALLKELDVIEQFFKERRRETQKTKKTHEVL